VLREEIAELSGWERRHRRLIARILLALLATLVVDAIGSVLVWVFERHARFTEIHTFGDAVFFTTVQLLTVSSQIRNPLTPAGRVVDVFLEIWALFVVTAIAGSFAAFFATGDSAT
jgi:uncharacterized membrane protein